MAGNLQRQLAEVQNNMLTAESAQASQEIVSSDNSWTVRVMNGMLQQQDVTGQWVDVAPIEELQQAKPANNAVTSVAPAQQPAADNENSNDNGGSDNNNSSDNGSSVRTNVKPCFWILNKVSRDR